MLRCPRRFAAHMVILASFLFLANLAGCAIQQGGPVAAAAGNDPAGFESGTGLADGGQRVTASRNATAAGVSPVQAGQIQPVPPDSVKGQLLSSARRELSEPSKDGLRLSIPEKAWAGEPFLVRVQGEGLESVTAVWRERTISASPGHGGQAEGAEILLSVLQKEKKKTLPLKLVLKWKDGAQETMTASLPVGIRDHPVQRLTVQQKYVTPDPALDEKIRQDRQEVRQAINRISPVKYWNMPLLRPVPGQVTSIYGVRRFFNGVEKNPHRGVDFDGKTGEPIAAVEDGMVVLVSDHYYGGQTVIIDHGLGVFTLYLHLSGFNVEQGQEIKRGDTVGFIGSTGRVTGPHLHLSLAVQGELVDAAPCIEGMGSLD